MNLENVFTMLPIKIRSQLLDSYSNVTNHYISQHWEPAELNAGKFCEIVFSIINGYMNGKIPDRASKPTNMLQECQNLERLTTSYPRALRIQIPRMLIALYEIRNNRGVGHINGDIKANTMDATAVLYMIKWVMAELVRIFHNTSNDEAQMIVDSIVERASPWIWSINGKKRILKHTISKSDQTLALLYDNNKELSANDIMDWIEYSSLAMFKRRVLKPLHNKRFIEHNIHTQQVVISPKGIEYFEKNILGKLLN